ncbi:MAG TPA: RagB/SusD family nutrient uptake outer membrane protein [Arachidicoccus soli]|nr:RagB/SusD family nutrient uptake outer membrane protein [Arachidicoccus soli]
MKKIYSVLLIVIFTSQACKKDFLKENPSSFLSPENVYKSDAGLAAGAVGLYSAFAQRYYDDGYLWNVEPIMDMSTDLMQAGTGINVSRAFALSGPDYTTSEGKVSVTWRYFYQIANSATSVIENANSHDWTDLELKKQVLGEAYFFRAYSYFYLSLFWGDVPIIDKQINGVKLDFQRSTQSKVMEFVLSDLKKSSTNLTYSDYQDQPGRINKGITQHLMSYVQLANKNWHQAELYADSVINCGRYALMTQRFGSKKDDPTGNPFWDLFQLGNQNPSSGNKEGLWIWQNENPAQFPAIIGTGSRLPRTFYPAYFQYSGLVVSAEYGGRGVGIASATPYWINLFGSTDTRGQEPNLMKVLKINNPKNVDFGKIVMDWDKPSQYDRSDVRLRPYPTKWNWEGVNSDNGTTSRDFYIFRLADTYLILAEAQMMQSDLGNAVINVNKVRARAGASDIGEQDLSVDFILEERARELFGEVSRRADLIRTGKYIERTKLYNEQAGPNLQDKHKLLPIPQSEIELNTGSKLGQNLGW